MLGAVPSRPWEQSLFKLVLTMMQAPKPEIPPSLTEHFNQVLGQAKILMHEPYRISGQFLPEAIDLALELQGSEKLSHELDRIPELSAISPVLASELLKAMEDASC